MRTGFGRTAVDGLPAALAAPAAWYRYAYFRRPV
jgi:hypothetical protein